MNIQRLKSVLLLFPAFIRRFIYRYHPGYRAKEKLAASIRQKDVITVAFLVMELACWKCDSLFRLMQQHSRFFPLIWIMRDEQIKNENEWARNLKEMQNFFALRGYQVTELLTLEEMRAQYAPDIVFLQKPFARVAGSRVRMMNRELTCYVPYCFQNGKKHDFIQGQENMIWRYFYTTPGILRICKQVMLNAAANVVITGSPTVDNFLKEEFATGGITWKKSQPGMKKIIWAPHWSISPGISWFQVSTFLAVADGMLQLAERYGDKVQWAFKPHPLLRDTLYQHPEWGIERTDAYYERWATMPNSQLETGDYINLFKESDAMVHDSGSFIMEYLLVNKPCMYLQAKGASFDFNEDTLKALACYQKGQTIDDVEKFVLNLLNGEADTLSSARSDYIQHYLIPPGGVSAAQNIINAILQGR